MGTGRRLQNIGCCLSLLVGSTMAAAAAADTDDGQARELEPVVVTTTGQARLLAREPSSISRLEQAEIERVGHTHVSELLFRVPGTWVTRNSGQEHLTAIRSPVLTGAGACGAFQFLEDGIPIRAAGFCNVNALFEINTEQAAGIEVIRGPANALYGSNALHGTINVLSRSAQDSPRRQGFLEAGPDDYYRGGFSLADTDGERWRISSLVTEDGGWRDDSGVSQQKLNARYQSEWAGGELHWLLSGSWLDQDTAGYVLGQDAYRSRPRDNDNPEAYRQAQAQRLAARWEGLTATGDTISITGYYRHQDMEFLQHFLPGQPLEQNSQQSLGMMSRWRGQLAGGRITLGGDLEFTRGSLSQHQDGEVEGDNAFLRETRPPGAHYDYDVDALLAALYAQHEQPIGDRFSLDAGLRLESIHYDYRNHLTAGNLRDDGEACGMGGCLYTRPADREDRFTTPTANIGFTWAAADRHSLFGRLAQGYRAPQATELYRLQSGQTVADLDAEALDSVELGSRGRIGGFPGTRGPLRYEVVAYYMEKDNFIYRDADGFNISNGATRHRGIELDVSYPLDEQWTLALNASHGRHTWAFDRTDGIPIQRGDEVDGAPRHLGSGRLIWQVSGSSQVELNANYVGSHYLDAGNEHRYHGHTVFSLRAHHELREGWRLHARLGNLTNRAYAERADYAFGNYRYFPGRERSLFLSLEYRR